MRLSFKKLLLPLMLSSLLILLLVGCRAKPQTEPYSITGDVVTVYGHEAVPDVTITFDGGFGTAQTLMDGTWCKNGLSGAVNIAAAKEGWFLFPEVVTANKSATIRFLAAPDLFNRIVFSIVTGTGTDIGVMGPDGSNRTQLTFSGKCWAPSWSPDGSKIVYVTFGDNESEIWRMNFDGTEKTQVEARDGYFCDAPSWSPDGASVIFPTTPNSGNSVGHFRVVNLNNPGLSYDLSFSIDGLNSLYPATWSPDGEWIAFIGIKGTALPLKVDIYIAHPDGTGLTQVTSNDSTTSQTGFVIMGARWSPDAQKLVFVGGRGEPYQLYIINRDGSGLKKLTNNATGSAYGPSWSPDGKKIAFWASYSYLGNDPRGNEIYIINADGSGLTRVTNPALGQQDATPCWSPF